MRALAPANPSGAKHLRHGYHCGPLSLDCSLHSCFQRWPRGAFPTSCFLRFSVAGFCNYAYFDSFSFGWVLVGLSLTWLYVVLKLRAVWDPGWICLIVLKLLICWFEGVDGGRIDWRFSGSSDISGQFGSLIFLTDFAKDWAAIATGYVGLPHSRRSVVA